MKREEQEHLKMLLEEFGLDNEQALVYIELFNGGSNSALNLSKKLDISRTNLYRILDQLMELGLLVKADPSAKSHFSAQPIKNLERTLLNEELRLEYMKGAYAKIQDFSDELSLEEGNPTKVIELDGLDGVRRAFWTVFQQSNEVLMMLSGQLSKIDDENFQNDLNKLLKETSAATKILSNQKKQHKITKKLSKIRQIDTSQHQIESDLLIAADMIVMIDYSLDKPKSIIISNNSLNKLQRKFFMSLWSLAN